mmetsp:Transcript_28666/g.64960  ORF Transcript_28666/g.64960 Transcript_28666/m.64960 type:complete len:561 (-) Transcript_28666:245-1927(-)
MVGEGTVLKGRWKLTRKIGQGAFGEIYSGCDLNNQDPVAVKLERWDNKKAVLKMEVAVLKKLQHSPYACRYVHCGHFENHNYLVMELLGDNLSELRRRRPNGRFSLWTTVRLGIQMVQAVKAIHELGYLHRDVKPSNFAMGLAPGRREQCVMIDFGLTRKFRLPSGQIRPARDIAGFRGTARYASINSHLSKELSRRDDLWSVLYVLIEFLTGQLPWRKLKDKEEIGLLKIHFNSAELVRDLPPTYLSFMQHLQALDYLDCPDYDYLVQLLDQLGGGIAEQTAYDWEQETPGTRVGSGYPGFDGMNNSSYGSVRRGPTNGRDRDVSTHEHQISQIEDGKVIETEAFEDGTGNIRIDGSSSVMTPRHGVLRSESNRVESEKRGRSSSYVSASGVKLNGVERVKRETRNSHSGSQDSYFDRSTKATERSEQPDKSSSSKYDARKEHKYTPGDEKGSSGSLRSPATTALQQNNPQNDNAYAKAAPQAKAGPPLTGRDERREEVEDRSARKEQVSREKPTYEAAAEPPQEAGSRVPPTMDKDLNANDRKFDNDVQKTSCRCTIS